MYTINNRVNPLLTGPLSHKYVTNPTSRFMWVGGKILNQAVNTAALVKPGKMAVKRVSRASGRGL